ncbi:DUF6549 family protein [Flavobacterium rhizosphaerae]|uniref:DUF6549 family protein n=1 Tax=Flavobacterium rhizosphaerae TaxID=3163298 RepID=A0ABW8Z1U3_9FLAO
MADINLTALNDTVKHYTNKLGTQTASISTLQLDKEQLQDLILSKDVELNELSKEFAKVSSLVKYKTITKYDTIAIIYTDSIPCDFTRLSTVKKEWYGFNYISSQSGFKIDSLTIPNQTTVITGTKRKWFLGKETITTDITNSNPYINVTDIKAAEIVIPVPWYKKWYVWTAAGLALGILSK